EEHPEQHHDYHGSHTEAAGGGQPPEEPVDPLFAGEEGGGPVKSFLEHLEDFRWIIIKCSSAIMVAMVVCLLAANYVIAILKWPLERATHFYTDKRQHVSVMMGPKELFNFKLATNNLPAWPLATNKFVELELVPMDVGTNHILTLGVRSVGDTVPAEKAKPLVYLNPAEPFLNSLHIAFFGGLLFAAPFVLYFLADFILPALKPREKQYFLKAMLPAAALFLAGVCLCYFLILPLALRAAEQYSMWMGVEMPFWKASEYFGFCIKFMLGMGLGFEMPVILLALVKIGLLDYQKLAAWRRYMILINLVLGALLTTPEVLTQVAMFFPLQTLYELTIWIAWYWEQEDRALARRRLTMVVGGIIIAVELVWLAVQFGWPWLRQFLH
ncbi:MAG: twin-arginine translocase subunit TatC, partial [Verrucomicrobia bacterium]|nr:twin-arginine translocase subunit TatC [Verrucomicrobiota bacterium]